MITATTRLAAVIGSPVRHSLSPVIHNAAFEARDVDGVYLALEVPPGRAAEAAASMRLFDWLGLSVTMPHKHDIAGSCDRLTGAAAMLDAVNCLFWSDGQIVGDNTDGEGFVRGLRADLGVDVDGMRCAVLGAGGAARAVIAALARAGAARVTVINRTRDRAEVAAAIAGPAGEVGRPIDIGAADLVVNATSVGMASTDQVGETPFGVDLLGPGVVVSDLVYHPAETPLLAAARDRGLRCQNGLAMLVFQAAIQFERWTGVDAPVDAMTAAAEGFLSSRP